MGERLTIVSVIQDTRMLPSCSVSQEEGERLVCLPKTPVRPNTVGHDVGANLNFAVSSVVRGGSPLVRLGFDHTSCDLAGTHNINGHLLNTKGSS